MSEPGFENKVIVDTSSFIDYLRYGKSEYIAALAITDSIFIQIRIFKETLSQNFDIRYKSFALL